MATEEKPLVLKDELARMAREADPASWLRDAHTAFADWRDTMPSVSKVRLDASLRTDQEGLELKSALMSSIRPLGLYWVDEKVIKFQPGQGRLGLHPTTLDNEQEFINHFLGLLRHILQPAD